MTTLDQILPRGAVHVVTGSRRLARNMAVRSSARTAVLSVVDALGENEVLFTGDADGPDLWAFAQAMKAKRWVVQWRLNAMVHVYGPSEHHAFLWTSDPIPGPRDAAWKRWPHRRNHAMVDAADGLSLRPRFVHGFIDVASETQGTQGTLDLCRDGWTHDVRRYG